MKRCSLSKTVVLCACLMPWPIMGEQPAVQQAPVTLPTGSFVSSFPAPVPGLPVPMDLKATQDISLKDIHITLACRQHEVMVIYTCVVDLPEDARKTTIDFGVPFRFDPAHDQPSNYAPLHRIPFEKNVTNVQVGANGIKMDHVFKNMTHPQKDAPSLQDVAQIDHWLVVPVKLNPGTNTVTFDYTIPYQQTISGNSGRQAQTSFSPSKFELLLSPAGTWGDRLGKVDVEIFPEEMVAQAIRILPSEKPATSRITDKGVIVMDLLAPENKGLPKSLAIQVGSEYQFPVNAEDLPDKLGRMPSILMNGKRINLINDYAVTASSSLQQGANGESCSPENLKTGRGFWAEGASGDGQGESLALTLNTPQKLAGLVIQSGASPLVLGRNDPEALRYPDIAFNLHSRPRILNISFNEGEYTFRATLRDDWNPQLIEIPYFNKSVKTIKITLGEVYQGSSNDNTYITTLLPMAE